MRRSPADPALVLALALALALGLAGCTTRSDNPAAPSPAPDSPGVSRTTGPAVTPGESPSAPHPSPTGSPSGSPTGSRPGAAPEFDTWVVGASPLPRRPDGFGEVRRTPPQLRDRLLPTVDVLPPPDDDRYHWSMRRIGAAFVRRTDLAWSEGCPVALSDLRYLRLSFWGFDGKAHTGELVVNASVARDVAGVFGRLFAARFPIEQMSLTTKRDLDAPPTGDGNVTSAYACRPTTGGSSWSAHAYGLAVDLNPFNNPYLKGDLVLPELASAYADRSWRRPGMILPGGPVTRAFADIGWTWGGDFRTLKDLHHFSATGN